MYDLQLVRTTDKASLMDQLGSIKQTLGIIFFYPFFGPIHTLYIIRASFELQLVKQHIYPRPLNAYLGKPAKMPPQKHHIKQDL